MQLLARVNDVHREGIRVSTGSWSLGPRAFVLVPQRLALASTSWLKQTLGFQPPCLIPATRRVAGREKSVTRPPPLPDVRTALPPAPRWPVLVTGGSYLQGRAGNVVSLWAAMHRFEMRGSGTKDRQKNRNFGTVGSLNWGNTERSSSSSFSSNSLSPGQKGRCRLWCLQESKHLLETSRL